jgi:hypothetical protein
MLNVCGTKGICHRRNSSYVCTCSDGYTGRNCEIKMSSCEPNPCINGKCRETSESDTSNKSGFKCDCDEGFQGAKCDIGLAAGTAADQPIRCTQNPCANKGICVETESTYFCYCAPGFVGSKCEFSYLIEANICEIQSPCKHGNCSSQGGNT